MIGNISVRIRPDVYIQEKGFAVLDEAVGVLEVRIALADGFDFSAAEGDAGLEALEEEVIVTGAAVLGGIALAGGERVARAGDFCRERLCRPAGWYGWTGGA